MTDEFARYVAAAHFEPVFCVPAEGYKEERKHLLPYTLSWDEPEVDAKEYNVRKDNTLLYHSNYYSLPLGTYTGPGSKVLVVRNVDLNELEIYDQKDFSLITRHDISPPQGKVHLKGRSCEQQEPGHP